MSGQLAIRIVFFLGLLNAVTLLGLFFSCRCIGARTPFSRMLRTGVYTRFYKMHCYYWIVLGISVTAHLTLALWVIGFPP